MGIEAAQPVWRLPHFQWRLSLVLQLLRSFCVHCDPCCHSVTIAALEYRMLVTVELLWQRARAYCGSTARPALNLLRA